MQKPKNYDTTPAYEQQEAIELGGHILKIIKVEEAVSSNGNPMIRIYLDTDKSDKQPLFFKKRYDNDTREEKRWGCIVYQLVEDTQTHETHRGLKTFHTCVEKSNNGFKVAWGDEYEACFKGKLIGGIFGREQYINSKGKPAFFTKCFFFRSVEAIKNGVDIPEDKLLPADKLPANIIAQPGPADFDEVPLPDDGDYPF